MNIWSRGSNSNSQFNSTAIVIIRQPTMSSTQWCKNYRISSWSGAVIFANKRGQCGFLWRFRIMQKKLDNKQIYNSLRASPLFLLFTPEGRSLQYEDKAKKKYLNREEKSLLRVARVSKCLGLNKSWSCKFGRKTKNIDMYVFPMHDCTQEQSGSPYYSSIVRYCKWPSLWKKVVEIQTFCYHDNMTSHFSSLWHVNNCEVDWKKKYPTNEKDVGIRACKDMMYEQVKRTFPSFSCLGESFKRLLYFTILKE